MDSNIRFPVAEIVIEGSSANSSLRQSVTRRRRKCVQRGRFAPDSLLGGNGFELQFLVARLSTVMGEGPAVSRSERICCGTEGSNPSPSSGESAANSEVGSTQEIVNPCRSTGLSGAPRFFPIMLGAGGKGLWSASEGAPDALSY
jgi:hypothetical protein